MRIDQNQPHVATIIVTALIAVALQLVVAPVITLFGVVPNFILVAVIITAIRNNSVRSTLTGFCLGLVFDFCSLGPIGGMTLVLTILGYAISSLNKGMFDGSILMDIIIMLLAVVFGEFLVSVIYAIAGVNQEFLLSLVQRVLPAIAYDMIIGFIALLVYNALVKVKPLGPGGGHGRSLTRKLNM